MDDKDNSPIQTDKARDLNFREVTPDKSKPKTWLYLVAGFALLTLLIGGYFLLNSKKPESKSTTSKQTSSKQATSSANPKLEKCAEQESLVNNKQGYEACFPKGWLKKELKASELSLGLDPKQVDDKFPGMITIVVTDTSEALTVQDISDNTSKFEFGPVKIDGVKGTQVTFTRLKSDKLIDYPSGISSVVSKFSRTYTITLNSRTEEFETNKVIYEKFLADFKFIDETKAPPWSESRNILLTTPWIGDSIVSPVLISGEAVAFEGTISIRIKDKSNHILAQTTTQNELGTERSAFKATVEFGKPSTKTGFVEVYTESAKDGSEQDLVSVPVVFP